MLEPLSLADRTVIGPGFQVGYITFRRRTRLIQFDNLRIVRWGRWNAIEDRADEIIFAAQPCRDTAGNAIQFVTNRLVVKSRRFRGMAGEDCGLSGEFQQVLQGSE